MEVGITIYGLRKDLQNFEGDVEGRIISEEETLDFIKQAGFECVDFSFSMYADDMPDDEFYARIKEIKEYADSIGIKIHQTHGRIRYNKAPSVDYLIDRAIKEIKATALLGAKYAVIHPLRTPKSNYSRDEENRKLQNLAFFGALKPHLQENCVIECIENLFGDDDERGISCPNTCSRPEEILFYLEKLGTENFGVCLDTGHLNLTGDMTGDTIEGVIRAFGKNLKVLHVHDNDKIKDKHSSPFMGNIDWREFARALKEVGYEGIVSLEVTPHRFLYTYNRGVWMEFYKFMRAVSDLDKMIW